MQGLAYGWGWQYLLEEWVTNFHRVTSEIKLDYIYWKFTARDHWYLKCNKPFNHYNNPMYWVHYDSHFRGKEAVSQRGQVLAWVPSHIYMGAQPELNLHNWILTCLLASSCGHILYDSVGLNLHFQQVNQPLLGDLPLPSHAAALSRPLLYHIELSEASWGRTSPVLPVHPSWWCCFLGNARPH